jgi:hypothetical protein
MNTAGNFDFPKNHSLPSGGEVIPKSLALKPLEGVPYDHEAYGVIYENPGMLDYTRDYVPDAPSEIRFLQEISQEYPNVNLVSEFRKARDWLRDAPPEKRPKNLCRFLRNWVSNAVNKYGAGQQHAANQEAEDGFYFVPADDEGGNHHAR